MSTVRRGLGFTLERVSRLLGSDNVLASLGRAVPWGGVLCLNYHRLGDAARDGFDQGVWSADAEAFDDQMRYVKLHTDVIGPHDLPRVVRGGKGRHLLLTFDDGYVDHYRIAFPTLKRLGLPGTFFVATGFMDQPRIPWWDEIAWIVRTGRAHGIEANRWMTTRVVFDKPHSELAVRRLLAVYKTLPAGSADAFLDFLGEAAGCGRYRSPDNWKSWMTWEMLREMRSAGMCVGGHTVNHPVLSQLSMEGQWDEISHCALRLSQELGEPMRYFGYPVGSRGSFNRDTRVVLQRLGVEYAFSYYGGMCQFKRWDDFDVRRNGVTTGMSPDWVRALVTLPSLYARVR
jgi:peptidoglycan/xylan/chitin deacetylase (PgdA/CDA1 family)